MIPNHASNAHVSYIKTIFECQTSLYFKPYNWVKPCYMDLWEELSTKCWIMILGEIVLIGTSWEDSWQIH